MEAKQSIFSFKGYLIQESHIIRKPKRQEKAFKIEISPTGHYFKTKKEFQLELKVRVFEENLRFDANILCIGFFSFKDLNAEEDLSNYFYTNAPAILFPYVRAHIAALTALSGMEVINIPTMNLTTLVNELKNNTITIQNTDSA